MKSFFLLAMAFGVYTAHAAAPTDANDCEAWKNKASLYMNWRQQGVPITEAIKDTAGNRSRGLLLRAYNEPQQQDFAAQFAAAETFSETIFRECQTQATPP
jgi:hypothetical protein